MMQSLKHPSFFRPNSRSSSPSPPSRPDSGLGFERVSRPLNKLSLSTFRRTSPVTSSSLVDISPVTLVQDGSYLEMLSLKLSEAVSKALTQPTGPAIVSEQVSGRRPIPAGRGYALGSLISLELKASHDNHHLHRAILRSLHRPLSVLITNLSAYLLPLISCVDFRSPPTLQAPNPNPTQLHALAIAALGGELLETFDELDLGLDADIRGDGLKAIREGLVSLVGKVVNPLIGNIRNEIIPIIDGLEVPNYIHNNLKALPTKAHTVIHPSIVFLQGLVPVYTRALTRYTASPTSQVALATFLISINWRGLLALSHRKYSSSPPLLSALTANIATKRRISPPDSPLLTPPSTKFTIKLPLSRPPSPPIPPVPTTAADDAHSLFNLLSQFPRPAVDKDLTRLAREAVDEAFEGLKAISALLAVVQMPTRDTENTPDIHRTINAITADLPVLIALPILLHAYGSKPESGLSQTSVASIIGLSEDEYRKGYLAGFSRAEDCASVVGRRVLEVLRAHSNSPGIGFVISWLEAELAETIESA